MTVKDLSKEYIRYAEDVISGKLIACEAIKLACKRYLDWFDRDDIYFDYDDVDKKIRFILMMKHFTGIHNGKPFILLPWQQWCLSHIFGWKWNNTKTRVTTKVLIFISRKNGKTAFASAIGLCCALCDKEPNAEVELVANSRQQAHIAFDMTYNFSESLDPQKRMIKRFRDTIKIPKTKSKVQVLSSDSMGLDGYNASCFILDEFHAAKDWNLYNVLISSQGMRQQPLAIVITTAGFLLNGYPCYEYRKTCIEILKGLKQDDSQFAAIYELDKDDDWQDENNWIKCSPSLGQTVLHKYMRDQITTAINQPSMEYGVKTKNLNMWVQSKDIWIPDTFIEDASEKVNIDDFLNEQCYMGVDLSSISDLTCTSVMFPPNHNRKIYPDKFVFKNYIYLPETALAESTNSELYKYWKRHNHIDVTSGNVVDYDYILSKQIEISKKTYIANVAYDSWNATQWAINATSEGLPLTPYSQAIGNFNKPTKTFEMLLRQNKIIIDNNPVIRWCFGNVELKIDYNENCKPVKANNDKSKKIDPVIAMLQALGIYLNEPHYNNIITAV